MSARSAAEDVALGHEYYTDVTCSHSLTSAAPGPFHKSQGHFSIISVEISSLENTGFLLFDLNIQEINSGDLRYAIAARCFRSERPFSLSLSLGPTQYPPGK